MKLAKIESLEEIKDIALLALLNRYIIDSHYAILIGLDSGCFKGECSGNYYSLDGSTNVSTFATAFNE